MPVYRLAATHWAFFEQATMQASRVLAGSEAMTLPAAVLPPQSMKKFLPFCT